MQHADAAVEATFEKLSGSGQGPGQVQKVKLKVQRPKT